MTIKYVYQGSVHVDYVCLLKIVSHTARYLQL